MAEMFSWVIPDILGGLSPYYLLKNVDTFYQNDEGGEFRAEIVGMSADVPMFGVADLSEILDLIQHTGADTLKKSRPLKVINFLKSEAVRMVRKKNSADCDRGDVEALFTQMANDLPDGSVHCIHEKPFFHQLRDLCDIPATGSQSPLP